MAKKSICATCANATWERTPKGNIRRSYAGRCTVRISWPPLPASVNNPSQTGETFVRGRDIDLPNPVVSTIWLGEAISVCPYWREAE